MKTVKKIIVTLVILTTANLINGAAEDQVSLNNQLIVAVENNAELQIIKNLLNEGADVNALDRYNNTPLHYAALGNNIDVAKELLRRGANVDAASQYQITPLHYAVGRNYPDMTKLLLEHSANTNLTDNGGDTAKAIAARYGYQAIVDAIQDWEDIPVTKGVMEEGL